MTTTENNKLIAEFMEYVHVTHYVYRIPKMAYDEPDFDNRTINVVDTFSVYFDDMKFDTDWNWLIEVVEKIEALENKRFKVEINFNMCNIYDGLNFECFEYIGTTKIEAAYFAVVEFIKWHNERKLISKN